MAGVPRRRDERSSAWEAAEERARGEGVSASIVVVSDPGNPAAESIRALRTHLMAQHVETGRRALAICGASAGVGASFVAANLAAATAQIGVKTLLVDTNLRRPGVEAYLPAASRGPGLAQFLMSDDIDWTDAVKSDVRPNLSVMLSGGPNAGAAELLGGERFRNLSEVCLREFDFTLFDTPPANTFADARRVCTVVGYGLVVARRNQSFFNDVKALTSQLRDDRATVVGTVLNEG